MVDSTADHSQEFQKELPVRILNLHVQAEAA